MYKLDEMAHVDEIWKIIWIRIQKFNNLAKQPSEYIGYSSPKRFQAR